MTTEPPRDHTMILVLVGLVLIFAALAANRVDAGLPLLTEAR